MIMSEEEEKQVKELAKDILRMVSELQVEMDGLDRENAFRAVALALANKDNYTLTGKVSFVGEKLSELITAIYNPEKPC